MAKSFKTKNVVLCEYVARGERNKHTLVNTYSGDVLVQQMPASLHFGLYIEHLPDAEGTSELDLLIKLDREEIATLNLSIKNQIIGRVNVVVIPLFEIQVNDDSCLKVIAKGGGYRSTTILEKNIYKSSATS